jgi:hypothetical protein
MQMMLTRSLNALLNELNAERAWAERRAVDLVVATLEGERCLAE